MDQALIAQVKDAVGRFCGWLDAYGEVSFRARELLVGWDNVPMHRWAQSQVFRSLSLSWLGIWRARETEFRATRSRQLSQRPRANDSYVWYLRTI
jgi:hypothetical protein